MADVFDIPDGRRIIVTARADGGRSFRIQDPAEQVGSGRRVRDAACCDELRERLSYSEMQRGGRERAEPSEDRRRDRRKDRRDSRYGYRRLEDENEQAFARARGMDRRRDEGEESGHPYSARGPREAGGSWGEEVERNREMADAQRRHYTRRRYYDAFRDRYPRYSRFTDQELERSAAFHNWLEYAREHQDLMSEPDLYEGARPDERKIIRTNPAERFVLAPARQPGLDREGLVGRTSSGASGSERMRPYYGATRDTARRPRTMAEYALQLKAHYASRSAI